MFRHLQFSAPLVVDGLGPPTLFSSTRCISILPEDSQQSHRIIDTRESNVDYELQ